MDEIRTEDKKKNIFERHPIVTTFVGFGTLCTFYITGICRLTDWAFRQISEEYPETEEEA